MGGHQKNILVDAYKIRDIYSGLGQFSLNFIRELAKHQGNELKLSCLVPNSFHQELPANIELVRATAIRRYFPSINKTYDLWHSLHQFPSHWPNKNTKQVLTIHDLNFLTEKKGAKAQNYLDALQKNVDRADILTAISEYTKQEILKHLTVRNKEVHVIHNGVSLPSGPAVRPANAPNKKFFFSISVFKRAKNFEVLLPMMKHLPDHMLIIAGNNDTDYGREIKSIVQQLGLADQVILSGIVTDAEKLWYYQQCEALLFPSLAEGFGLPVIEAMMCGKPVFLSRATCLPEIGGEQAGYFESFDPQEMAKIIRSKMVGYDADPGGNATRIQQYASQFNWNSCIQKYLNIYNS